jgi:magnesium transporter
LEEVEKEVVGVDELGFAVDHERREVIKSQYQKTAPMMADTHGTEENADPFEKLDALVVEKSQPPSSTFDVVRTRMSLPRLTIPFFFRRIKRAVHSLSTSIPVSIFTEAHRAAGNSTASKLHRMTRTRRVVTSLTRLLATKSDVVAQIRKRLLTTGLGNGTAKDDDIEVAIYMGDIQGMTFASPVFVHLDYPLSIDHILTLQHSLAHYERMLSQSHPTYLSQLRVTTMKTKQSQDKAVMLLTIVIMAVLCNLPMIGKLPFVFLLRPYSEGSQAFSLLTVRSRPT